MKQDKKDDRTYLEYFWNQLPSTDDVVTFIPVVIAGMATKILEVESHNITDFTCHAAHEYVLKNPVRSAAVLLTIAGLSYAVYNISTEDKEGKKLLKEQEEVMQEKSKVLTDFLEDIRNVHGSERRIEVAMGAIEQFHDELIEDFKNGKGINQDRIDNIKFVYQGLLEGLPKEATEKVIKHSLEFIDSLRTCDEMQKNLKQGTKFADRFCNKQGATERGL
jgi:hypothetical protein